MGAHETGMGGVAGGAAAPNGAAMGPSEMVVQFGGMVECLVRRGSLAYNGYGCHCGLGGSGKAVDATDRWVVRLDSVALVADPGWNLWGGGEGAWPNCVYITCKRCALLNCVLVPHSLAKFSSPPPFTKGKIPENKTLFFF